MFLERVRIDFKLLQIYKIYSKDIEMHDNEDFSKFTKRECLPLNFVRYNYLFHYLITFEMKGENKF
jgi:hypothetical protein